MSEWRPIETAPEKGKFLVYMPEGEPKIQTAVWHPNIKIIGNHFQFDMWKPTHWMPLPAPPTPEAVRLEAPFDGHCGASRDGECGKSWCPQLRDNEPATSGRHCPLDGGEE